MAAEAASRLSKRMVSCSLFESFQLTVANAGEGVHSIGSRWTKKAHFFRSFISSRKFFDLKQAFYAAKLRKNERM